MRRLLRDRRATSAIEFAILAPVVILVITAAWEGFMIASATMALENGALTASRLSTLGGEEDDRLEGVRAALMQRVCPEGRGICFLGGGNLAEGDDGVTAPLRLTFRGYSDPRNIGRAEPFSDVAPENGRFDEGEPFTDVNGDGVWNADMGRATLGGAGEFVSFTAEMSQAVANPALRAALGARLIHEVRFVVRNEPF